MRIEGVSGRVTTTAPGDACVATAAGWSMGGWYGGGGEYPYDLALGGTVASELSDAAQEAGVDYLIVTASDNESSTPLIWLTGSLWGRNWGHVEMSWLSLVALSIIGLLLSFRLNLVALGDETATGLGLNMRRERLLLLTIAVTSRPDPRRRSLLLRLGVEIEPERRPIDVRLGLAQPAFQQRFPAAECALGHRLIRRQLQRRAAVRAQSAFGAEQYVGNRDRHKPPERVMLPRRGREWA